MRFPSLSSLAHSARKTFTRFPLAILLAITATVLSIALVRYDTSSREVLFIRCTNGIISCYLGMLLSIAATVWSERKAWQTRAVLGLQTLVAALTIFYYFTMPDFIEEKRVIRWVLYGLGLHGLIAVIGFAGTEHINGFWQYNKKLFLRILTSILYTTVLYLGLFLALEAIDHLFNADISYKWYLYVWLVLIGIFNTWFFLAGFPTEYGEVDVIADYPKGLKIFTQYVLLPLLSVYMVILYAYILKIIFTAHWPSGWVTYLVLGFSVAGILALLLIYPMRNDEGNKWINVYSRFFYFALFPLLGLLGLAIWKRVKEYGVTELRYFVLLLAAWLFCTAVYFLWSKKKNIQLIPLSLCLFAFLSSFGGWGVFSVAKNSQLNRLKGIMAKNKMMEDDRVKISMVKVSLKDRQEISSTTEYIVSMHGYEPLQPWFRENLDSMMRRDSLMGRYEERERAEDILKLMHIKYASQYTEDTDVVQFSYQMNPDDIALTTDGLPYLMPMIQIEGYIKKEASENSYRLGEDSIALWLDSARSQLRLLTIEGRHGSKDTTIFISLLPVLKGLPDSNNYGITLTAEQLTLPIHTPQWNGKFIISEMNGLKRDNQMHVETVKGYLLLGRAR